VNDENRKKEDGSQRRLGETFPIKEKKKVKKKRGTWILSENKQGKKK